MPDDLAVQVGDQGEGVQEVAVGAQPVQDAGLEAVLGSVGHAEREVVQGTQRLEVARPLAAQHEVTVHGAILSGSGDRASEYSA